MPDWERLVAERLAHSTLAPEVQREVVAEIAAHLEECYAELLAAGSPDPERQTLAQVSDWEAFGRRIRRSKEDRMRVVRKIVMPGIAAVILAQAALRLCVYLFITPEPCGPDVTCIRVSADGPAYLPWLATLLLVGGLGAALARRFGAGPAQRLIAAVAPAVYLAAETLVYSILDGFFWRVPIYWVIVPALVCAVGSIPFLGGRRDPLETQPVSATLSSGGDHQDGNANLLRSRRLRQRGLA